MADKNNPEQPDDHRPTIISGPIPVPVETDHAVAYGNGRDVHWEREIEGEEDRT